ncbi:MAG: fibronectin type III-like domain-contianing protein, partial [Paludibacteraceae bacterium]|nr:fibronectin type III-like domain-contianing protein [Paludibacteraceae bacterium]
QYGELGFPGVPETMEQGQRTKDYMVEEYKEDVFVGYRYADKAKLTPVFPFGHGLSYTTFTYSNISLNSTLAPKAYTLNLTVANSGETAGAEVIQVYVGENKPTVARPVKELKAFEKVYLEPGESKTITIALDPKDWGYWDEAKHQFVTNPGKYTIYVGTSSRKIVGKVNIAL